MRGRASKVVATLQQAVLNVIRFYSQDGVHMVGALMLLLCLCRKFYAIGLGRFDRFPFACAESAESASFSIIRQ